MLTREFVLVNVRKFLWKIIYMYKRKTRFGLQLHTLLYATLCYCLNFSFRVLYCYYYHVETMTMSMPFGGIKVL